MIKNSFDHIEDIELLNRFYSDGNTQWLGILLQRYTFLLLGVCMKYLKNEEEAKDSVQQIFLKALTEIPKYKVVYFKSWIYMIAKNFCLMKLRSSHGKISVQLNDDITKEDAAHETRTALLEKEMALVFIERSLEELSEEQKQCVTLFYLKKKSYQQITEITGYHLLQVKSFIQNGKRNLKNIVEKKMKNNE